jgi:hypothetical protein
MSSSEANEPRRTHVERSTVAGARVVRPIIRGATQQSRRSLCAIDVVGVGHEFVALSDAPSSVARAPSKGRLPPGAMALWRGFSQINSELRKSKPLAQRLHPRSCAVLYTELAGARTDVGPAKKSNVALLPILNLARSENERSEQTAGSS